MKSQNKLEENKKQKQEDMKSQNKLDENKKIETRGYEILEQTRRK